MLHRDPHPDAAPARSARRLARALLAIAVLALPGCVMFTCRI